MGDRCYLEITLREKDLPIFDLAFSMSKSPGSFLKWLDNYHTDEKAKTVTGFATEANYGWYSELEEAARLGAVFIAHNSAGSEYGAGVFACSGSKSAWLATDENKDLICTLDKQLRPRHITRIKKDAAILRNAERILAGKTVK